MMRRLFALIVLAFIAACSGDNGTAPQNNNNGGGGGTSAVTTEDSVRVQTLQALAGQMEAWDGQSPDSIAAHAVAYLRGLPSVKKAGVAPGTTTVWANFTGGFDLIIPNNRATSTMSDTLVDAMVSPPPASRMASAPRRLSIPTPRGGAPRNALVPTSALELPDVATFRAVNAIGTCHINPLPVIKQLLTKGNYADANPGLPTVANLKNVSGDGVFYINSHGGPGFDANQVAYYAVWTLDPIDVATLANYKPMINSHELVGMLETSNDALGNCAKVMHYGFTSKFVRNHMHFAKNSLVIIDCCHSSSGPAANMRAAFGAVGASAYVGWTSSVADGFAYAAMKYLLDRLMGLNEISPESPKQRAFNIDDVRKDMETNRHLTVDPMANAVLTVSKLKNDFGILSPSIQFLSLEENTENAATLLIAGLFGTDPGDSRRRVTINGNSLNVTSWEPTLIACDIDTEGPNAAGTVVVEVGSGNSVRRSNEVNMTEWKGDLKYDRDDPGDQAVHITMHVHFRADIHSFRDEPHEAPFETTVLFSALKDASADIATSGSFSLPQQGDCLDTFNFVGTAQLPSPYEADPDGGWMYFGSVDTQHHKLQLNLRLLSLFHVANWVRTGPAECAPGTFPMYGTITVENCVFDETQGLTAFDIPMSGEFSVEAGGRGPCSVDALLTPLYGYTANASIHWDAFSAQYLPDPDAAR